uniref:GPI ethanolamine phosphate transferase 1 n=1 Tax=Lygus hesperus TaxID=30085 RepID=A0A0A9Z4T6_LYGHE
MKLAWVSLVFHVAMLLWLREDGMPSFKRSIPCGRCSEKRRLMVVVLPGLGEEHGAAFKSFPEGSVGRVRPHNCPATLSYFAGVAAAPLLPELLDTIFDHVDLTVFSGRKEFIIDKEFMKVNLPAYYRRRRHSKSERAEMDGLVELLVNEVSKGKKSPLRNVNSTLFLLELGGLAETNVSLDIVRRLQMDIRDLAHTIDFTYGDERTNVLLVGDNGGPFAVWGPDVEKNAFQYSLRSSDVAPLISALLGVAVPFDSIGRLDPSLVACPQLKAESVFCNALQLSTLLNEVTKGPTMTDLKYNSTPSLYWLSILRHFQWYDRATESGFVFTYMLSGLHQLAKTRLNQILAGVMMTLTVSWIYLLWVELAAVSYAPKCKLSLPFIFIHVLFAILTVSAASLPFWMKWPYSFHLYMVCPFIFVWAAVSRIEALASFFKATSWKDVPKYLAYLMGTLLLAEYSLRASNSELLVLMVGLCVLVHYPALPRFVVSPFLAKCGWWVCCFCLLGSLYLPQWSTRQPKLLNLCGTILICLSGFSSFWVTPCRDVFLSVLLTFLTAAAMLIQSLSRVPQYLQHLKYLTGPMMLMPFLPLFGKNRTKNRVFHLTFASAALLMLTSTRLEPLCFLLAVVTCGLWTLMENFRLADKLGTDEIRRSMFLGIILHTTVAVTRTLPTSYAHLDSPQWIPMFDLYRHTMILTCFMTIYLTMIPSDVHTYSSFVILMSADAIASLRAVISGVDSTQLHLHGIALALAFYLGSLLATRHSKPDPNDIDDHQPPNLVLPPDQHNS